MRRLAALNQTMCTRAPTERRCSPTEVVLVGKWVALLGFTEILQARPPMWTWAILTKANVLCTVEGGRLPQQGCTRCVDTSGCFEYLTARMSWVEEPTYTLHMSFYSHKSCDLLHMCDQWLHS